MNQPDDVETEVIAETENYAVLRSQEEEDTIYHVELSNITLHLESEEWDELVLLIKSAA